MECRHFQRGGRPVPGLVERAGKTPANEARPREGAEPPASKLGEDVVCKPAARHRAHDGAAIGEPLAGLTGHAGTIAADRSQSVMDITIPAVVSRNMRLWPEFHEPIFMTSS